MEANNRIALSIPNSDKQDRFFSFRLKHNQTIEPSVYTGSKHIFVVSDIEGNFRSFCKILRKGGVVNRYLRWTFGENHLVIAGDCFDRGEEVTECLWLIYSLEEKAKKEGGYVHFILGNHEIMNMNGDWRYVHPRYTNSVGSKNNHAALYDGNNELWRWLQTKNIIEKIDDILFVHAGISHELIRFGFSVSDINNLARPYYTSAREKFSDSFLALLFDTHKSPFWYRGYYLDDTSEDQIDAILDFFGVKTIVTGHTVTNHINSYFNGKVINVNTDHALGNTEGLLINNYKKFYRVTTDGKRERIK